jgi:hypothetical protein
VTEWYSEISNYDYDNPGTKLDKTKEIKEFTQVVWVDTKQLGCGIEISATNIIYVVW